MSNKIVILRIVHGLLASYFLLCLGYIYFAVVSGSFNYLLAIAIISLAIEGVLIFILNKGDCPLIHIQRKLGDNKPFFELFFPPAIAKRAIPVFANFAWLALALLIIRAGFELIS